MGFSFPRRLSIAATIVALLAAGTTAWLWRQWQAPPQQAVSTPAFQLGGPFDLVDQNGNLRNAADFRGQYMLVQFGYTYCPDVCSVALDTMSRALDILAERDPAKAQRVAPIFISVDPARDTVAVLKDFAANFHPRLVALTGTREQVARAATAYRIYFAKVADGPSDAAEHAGQEPHDHGGHDHGGQGQGAAAAEPDYLIAHSTVMYLMGPDGGYLTHFSHGSDSGNIAQTLAQRIGD
jgi:protein SCO1/2